MTSPQDTGLPLSAAQTDIWFDEQFATGSLAYNMGDYLDIRGPVDTGLLYETLRVLLTESENSRVRFTEIDGEPRQVIEPLGEPPVTVFDLSAEADPEAAALAWIHEDMRDPFDVTEGRLTRWAIITLADDRVWCYMCVHHIIGDGYSEMLWWQRVAAIYAALEKGESTSDGAFPPLAQLVNAEIEYTQGPRWEKDRAYWNRELEGAPELVSLSGREPEPASAQMRRNLRLDDDTAATLRAVAEQAKVTWPTFVIAATGAYLRKLLGTEEVLLTLPIAGRSGPAMRAVPGMVANYVPVRLRVGNTTTVRDVLTQASKSLARALKAQRFPTSKIRKEMALRVDNRRPFGPFVNVLPGAPALKLGECTTVLNNLSTGIVNDLMVTVVEPTPGGVEVHFNGNPELYSAEQIEGHLDRFVQFMLALAHAGPDELVSRVDVVTGAEGRDLADWGTGEWVPDDCETGVLTRVRAIAGERPDAVAVVDDEREVTYARLVAWADRLAGRLGSTGVGPNSLVGVLAAPGACFAGSILGIFGAGAAYVPLDVTAPVARNASLLSDNEIGTVVVGEGQEAAAEQLAAAYPGVTLVPASHPFDGTFAEPATEPGSADDLAYVIFTSGSTGKPKGAMIHRAGMLNHLLAKADTLGMTAADRTVHNAPVTFDISVWQMLAPLLTGGTVRTVSRDTAADPDVLFGTAHSEGVTVLEVVPSLLGAALDTWATPPPLPHLRWLLVTGETLPPHTATSWTTHYPHIPLVNAYGPTECSDDVTHATIGPDNPPVTRTPIGTPLRNTRLYILDDQLRPVPPGTPGELYVAGIGVGRGYLHNQERTTSTYIADPFASDGSRMYRTGDHVQLIDGELHHLQRRDHQVKIRGHRIELGEIEAALRTRPGVTGSVVLAVPDANGHQRLIGYVTGPSTLDGAVLRDALREFLPEYLVPSAIVALPEFPLTPHGKLDRDALPTPDLSAARQGRAPRTPEEEIICAAMAGALGVKAIGADDNFFALGGDSIIAIQAVTKARKAGLVFTPRDIFTHKTPASLALVAKHADAARETVDDGVGQLDLTPIAHQLNFETNGQSEPVAEFSQYVVLPVPSEVDAATIGTALQTVLDRHDALRMRLDVPTFGVWSLEIAERGSVRAESLVRTVAVPAGTDPAAAVEEQVERARERLAPDEGRMVQAVLLESGPGKPKRLLLMVHHLAVDGVSWRIIVPDLRQAWEAVSAGRAPELDPVGTSYRRWSQLLSENARTSERLGEVPLWTEQLSPVDSLLGRRALETCRDVRATAHELRLELSGETTAALLTSVPAAFNAEINDVLLAALAMAVADWRQRTQRLNDGRVLVELEGHGREHIADELDLGRTVGWFTSVFPVCFDLGQPDWPDLWAAGETAGGAIKTVKEQLRALPDHGLGFGLLRFLNPQTVGHRGLSGIPQIGFNYLGRFSAGSDSDWALESATMVGTGTSPDMPLRHVLAVTPVTEDRADGPHLVADWLWAGEVLEDEDAEDIARTWFRALETLVEHASAEGAGGPTPSDFSVAGLSQADVDGFHAATGGISDVLSLSPLQQGLLFHSEFDDGDAEVYALQVVVDLDGPVDADAMREACAAVLARHANLRAAFRYTRTGQPVQLIPEHVRNPFTEIDVSGLSEVERAAELDRLTAADRERRFDVTEPPLMRFTMVRTGEDRCRLLWTFQHILVDGWSMPILAREVFALYADPAAALPEPRPYRDYLAWLDAQDRESSLEVWRTVLSGLTSPTRVAPVDVERTPTLSESSVTELPEDVTTALTAFARANDLTVNSVVQGCWAVLLGHLTGQSDVVFGATASVRPPELAGSDEMVGMFLNTLPVRAGLDPASTLRTLFATVQDQRVTVRPHEYLGLVDVQNTVAALAGTGELFDTAVVFENFPMDPESMKNAPSGTTVRDAFASDARHYPLSLVVLPGSKLTLRLDYLPEVFSADEVDGFAARFRRLLDIVLSDVDTPLGRLELLGSDERAQSLLQGTPVDDPAESTDVVQRVRDLALSRPAAIAVADDERELTYAQAAGRSSALARRLDGAGLVAVFAAPGTRFVCSILGALGAGGAYLPLDVTAPIPRNAGILGEAGAATLVTTEDLRALAGEVVAAAGTETEIVVIDDAEDPLDDLVPLRGSGADLAYVIFTSGSTGKPKGAMIHRAGMLNHLYAKVDTLGMTESDKTVHNAPVTFDISVWQMLAPLLTGGTVRTVSHDTAADPNALFGLADTERVTILEVVPSLLGAALDLWAAPPPLPHLRWLLVTGETLPPDTAARWTERYPGIPLVNAYGPTECSDDVTHATIGPDNAPTTRSPIGTPLRNTRLYILDDQLRPVAPGTPGELYVAGIGVGPGYLRNPVRTASAYLPDPYASDGTRMYRTGDHVQLTDGQLHHLQRRDHQVKIRGHRIELGEIETALRTRPEVAEAAVRVDAGTVGHQRLIGYVTPAGGAVDGADVRRALQGSLPDYLVPSVVLTVDRMPLTPHGKLDRDALPLPEADFADVWGGRAAQTKEEEVLCTAMAEVLGLSRIGAEDNFFALGGDSILSIKVVGLARSAGLAIGIRDVFRHKTAAAIAGTARWTAEAAIPEAPEADDSLLTIADDEMDELELGLD
ncbi:amino acid adenylation domain-containing protein [Amycolatopsis minnesotensis]|uniref:Carrier domain-containing protein n=1 Tax=Amycolatopsis minnesotensis TaxID=337894 RepID=A0ABP5DDH2_9PSEU